MFVYGASAFPTQSFHSTNYWVDAIFAEATGDSSGPTITNVHATALDGSTALVTWDTNEAATSQVQYSTDPGFAPEQTHSASDGAFVLHHSLTLTGLTFNTTYFLDADVGRPIGERRPSRRRRA